MVGGNASRRERAGWGPKIAGLATRLGCGLSLLGRYLSANGGQGFAIRRLISSTNVRGGNDGKLAKTRLLHQASRARELVFTKFTQACI